MTSREYVDRAIAKQPAPGNAFWVGHPSDEARSIYFGRVGIADGEAAADDGSVLLSKAANVGEIDFNAQIGSDMVWLSPELDAGCWRHPQGKPMWDAFAGQRHSLGDAGVFAECEDAKEIEAFDWPNQAYLDLSTLIEQTKYAHERGLAVFGGMWCPFFHVLSDFFGMENYFCKMHTDPEVVHAATERVVDFYVRANQRVLAETGAYLTAGFFGNDFGTQLDLMVSPACFDEFLLPYMKRIVAVIREAGLKVAMHSCGAIGRVIPKLIDAGVDILHPLQAKASGMDAAALSQYRRDRVFMGGVDTQQLLPFGSAEQVYAEVMRLREAFGDGFIVSPSHEALLPNVPFENVLAMAKAAKA